MGKTDREEQKDRNSMSERLTHEGDAIFQKKFWELGILRCMTPASPYCLQGNTIWFILKIHIKRKKNMMTVLFSTKIGPYSMRYNISTAV